MKFLTTLSDRATRNYGERVLDGLRRLFRVIHRHDEMTEAQFDTVSADLTADQAGFRATGRTLRFDGFLKLYREEDEEDPVGKLRREADEARDEYLRLYAEFDNYKKRTARDKAELAKYANESIVNEFLTSVDNLEVALKHADEEETNKAFLDGVKMTLRELYRAFEKFGVTPIKAEGEPFDPEFHHAVAHLERDDMDENMVVVDLRKGFMYNDKVLRASMVSVSKKPSGQAPDEENNT